MTIRFIFKRVVLIGLFCVAFAASADDHGEQQLAQNSIGVVPFENVGMAASDSLYLEELLVRRLGTLGIENVVSLRELSKNQGIYDSEEIRKMAETASVDAVLVGRITKLGGRLSLDSEVLSGKTGQRLGDPFFVESESIEDLGAAVETLASKALVQWRGGEEVSATRVLEAENPTEGAGSPLFSKSDEPLSIRSDELEAVETAGERHLVFRDRVRVVRGEMVLKSDLVEAFYEAGSSQPQRLIARGRVIMTQGERRARCQEATFEQSEGVIVCTGDAQIDDGCDRITAEVIRFDTAREIFMASRNVKVNMNRDDPACGEVGLE